MAINKVTPTIYRVLLRDEEQPIYARKFYRSDVYGFIELEEFVFAEDSGMIVNPAEEKLKNELNGVQRTYIPYGRIERIDEIDAVQVIKQQGEKVAQFPGSRSAPMPTGKNKKEQDDKK